MTNRLLRLRDVMVKVSLGSTRIYELLKLGKFPVPVRIGSAVRWRESDLDQWIAELPEQRKEVA